MSTPSRELVVLVVDDARAHASTSDKRFTALEARGTIRCTCPECGGGNCDVDTSTSPPVWSCRNCDAGGGCIDYAKARGLELPPLDMGDDGRLPTDPHLNPI